MTETGLRKDNRMAKTSKSKSESFNENYRVLKEIAEQLRQQAQDEDPDIDGLVPKVEQASQAYKICMKRLDAVKKALDEHMPESIADDKAHKDKK